MARRLPTKYCEAVAWIAANDDTTFMGDGAEVEHMSVTLSMAADLWNIPREDAIEHLRFVLAQAAGDMPNRAGPLAGYVKGW